MCRMGLNLDNLPQRDFYSVEQIADSWGCSTDDIDHYIEVHKSLRFGQNAKDISGDIQTVYIDDDQKLINSLANAFNQKLPVQWSYFDNGVKLHAKDIGAEQFDKLVKYTSNRSAKKKIWKESDFIYEDIANIQRTEPFRPLDSAYPGGITWNDEKFDEDVATLHLNIESSHDYYVTGFDYDGDRFLLVNMDSKNEEYIFRPILRRGFSTIPREEKERFEIAYGMLESHKDSINDPTSSNPLAIFRAMKDLEFKGMKISVDPERYKITITAQEQTAPAGFGDFGFFQKNTTILNRAGRIFLQLVNNTYNHSAKGSSRALTDLSHLLKTALDTQATPFRKGDPQFQLSIPKFDEAKRRALDRTSPYEDKMGTPENLSADDYLKNDSAANPDYPFSLDDDEPSN